ncbi:MAG: DUF5818 domain-containing protein [Acidobacteriota bacterium]|nr:DUF5818 domain-containing protein [Acidobacteriota bacterium]
MKKASVTIGFVLFLILGTLSSSAQAREKKGTKNLRTFTGEIMDKGGKYVLYDTAHKTTYQLDDQDRPKAFAGQKVTVSGTYSKSGKMIHVQNMEARTDGGNARRSPAIPPEVAHPDPTGPITPPTFPPQNPKDPKEANPVKPPDPTKPTTTTKPPA